MILVDNTPFSIDILAKSIESAGINPFTAKSLCFNIREQLLNRNLDHISRDNLRDMVANHIREFAPEAIKYYLAWSGFRRKQDALVILVSGSTGSGKSTIAGEVAYKLGISRVVSTDTIRSIMRSTLSEKLTPLLHKSSFDAWEAINIPLEALEDKIIFAFREQATQVTVGIHAAIDRALTENVSLVIEGVHIIPGFIKEKYLHHPKVVTVLLATDDQVIHRGRFLSREESAVNRSSSTYLEYFDCIRRIQDYLINMATTEHIPIFNNVNLDDTIYSVLNYVNDKFLHQGGVGA